MWSRHEPVRADLAVRARLRVQGSRSTSEIECLVFRRGIRIRPRAQSAARARHRFYAAAFGWLAEEFLAQPARRRAEVLRAEVLAERVGPVFHRRKGASAVTPPPQDC